jgi:hypothetical protein
MHAQISACRKQRGLRPVLECVKYIILRSTAEKKKPRFRGALNVQHERGLGCSSVPRVAVLMRPPANRSRAEGRVGLMLLRLS